MARHYFDESNPRSFSHPHRRQLAQTRPRCDNSDSMCRCKSSFETTHGPFRFSSLPRHCLISCFFSFSPWSRTMQFSIVCHQAATMRSLSHHFVAVVYCLYFLAYLFLCARCQSTHSLTYSTSCLSTRCLTLLFTSYSHGQRVT